MTTTKPYYVIGIVGGEHGDFEVTYRRVAHLSTMASIKCTNTQTADYTSTHKVTYVYIYIDAQIYLGRWLDRWL